MAAQPHPPTGEPWFPDHWGEQTRVGQDFCVQVQSGKPRDTTDATAVDQDTKALVSLAGPDSDETTIVYVRVSPNLYQLHQLEYDTSAVGSGDSRTIVTWVGGKTFAQIIVLVEACSPRLACMLVTIIGPVLPSFSWQHALAPRQGVFTLRMPLGVLNTVLGFAETMRYLLGYKYHDCPSFDSESCRFFCKNLNEPPPLCRFPSRNLHNDLL